MLKNSEKYQNKTHFTASSAPVRRPEKQTSGNRDFTLFISVFIIGVLIILGFAKILSPNVDVEIANEGEYLQLDDNSRGIDERLHNLKMEDSASVVADEEMFSPELDERVVLPKQLHKTAGEIEAEMLNEKLYEQKVEEPKKVDKKEVKADTIENKPEYVQTNTPVTARVIVGSYATEKQAEVAKSIIHDAGIGVTPLVKNMGTYYTLQVGSYSSAEKAQQAANNLLKNNFPARVVIE